MNKDDAIEGTIVPAKYVNRDGVNSLKEYLEPSGQLSAARLQAISALSSSVVPDFAVKTHPGKGGKTFSYITHVWVSAQLNEAFGQAWGMDIKSTEMFDDGSVAAVVQVYIDFTRRDGSAYRRTVSEVGTFDGGGGKMSKANMIASAVSRGMVKCCFRLFRLGESLYDDLPDPTLKSSWESIAKMGQKRGLTLNQIKEALKTNGIKYEQLLEQFVVAWRVVYDASNKKEDVGDF